MTNINQELFKRYAPNKKLEIVNNLTEQELLFTFPSTIERIIKEIGTNRDSKKLRDPNKYLKIPSNLQVGNDWNSDVVEVGIYRKNIYVNFYVQYGDHDTDGTFSDSWKNFLRSGVYQGEIKGEDYYGNTKYYYYRYSTHDKTKVIKSILLTYIHIKYKDKLCME